MQLETERLVLRDPQPGDVDDLLEMIEDDEVMRWIGSEGGDRDLAVELVQRWMSRWEHDDVGVFCVLLDGHVIGRVGLLVWDASTWETSTYERAGRNAQPELGWAIARRFWGSGYATEAARAIRDWAFAERNVERLVSLIAPDNVRSARVAEKLDAVRTELIETSHSPAYVWVHPR
jgi:RimJ/RimL family protein N-acetyltransferase